MSLIVLVWAKFAVDPVGREITLQANDETTFAPEPAVSATKYTLMRTGTTLSPVETGFVPVAGFSAPVPNFVGQIASILRFTTCAEAVNAIATSSRNAIKIKQAVAARFIDWFLCFLERENPAGGGESNSVIWAIYVNRHARESRDIQDRRARAGRWKLNKILYFEGFAEDLLTMSS